VNLGSYIGIPFRQHGRGPTYYDCWGFVRLIYKNELGITLPDYEYGLKDQWEALRLETGQPTWTRTNEPLPTDVVLLVAQANPHVGIYLSEHRMLHLPEHGTSCIESLDAPRWRSRVEAYYRYG
jgi:cell wall-associated NlpC family hydrolase